MDALLNFFYSISGILWGNLFLVVLIGTGIMFTIILKFPQIRRIGDGFRLSFGSIGKGKADKEGMSSWQSLATAIAGQVGTGNIAGPATAIMSGGPGAVFWVWVAAFLGQATIFAEATAAQKFKEKLPDGTTIGGPAHYIYGAFPNAFGKGLGNIFSVLILFGFAMAAAMIQGNTIADSMRVSYGVPMWITGVIVAIVLFTVVVGGITRIASVTSALVPVMAIIYILGCVVVLFKYGSEIIPAFAAIFKFAFSGDAAWGGFVGISVREAIRFGVARGLFSNEAGVGSTPHAHAVAKVKHPCDQGLVAMVSIVIDSFIILTLSALVILASGAYKTQEPGIGVVTAAFTNTFGPVGNIIISISVLLFCFSTIIAGYFYGEQNFKKLFGVGTGPKSVYIALIMFFTIFGSVAPVPLVWAICDVGNGLMVFVNVIGLWGCAPIIYKLWKEYEKGGTTLDTTLNDYRMKKAEKKALQNK